MAKEDWDHATELAKFVLDINPAVAKMRWYLAGAPTNQVDDEAIALFRESRAMLEAAKQFPQAHLFTGLIYARRTARQGRCRLQALPVVPPEPQMRRSRAAQRVAAARRTLGPTHADKRLILVAVLLTVSSAVVRAQAPGRPGNSSSNRNSSRTTAARATAGSRGKSGKEDGTVFPVTSFTSGGTPGAHRIKYVCGTQASET
jgi:hypothetical protein